MYVLDASAVLAYLYQEPGADDVASRLDGSLISSLNFSEVLQKAKRAGLDLDEIAELLRSTVGGVVPFDDVMAVDAAKLWDATHAACLALADRACLTLAAAVSGIAVTTDAAWGTVDVPGAGVHVVRRT